MGLTKKQKIKIIADIKKGNITREIAKHIERQTPLISEKEFLINGMTYNQKDFNVIHSYLTNELKLHCAYFLGDNSKEVMINLMTE